MSTSGNPKVFLILIACFIAVGIYLFIYGRKRRAMLRKFSLDHGFRYSPRDEGCRLENELSDKLRIEETGKVRGFSRIKDIVAHGDVAVFRCIQLLDLSPYDTEFNTHNHNICVTFPTDSSIHLFVMRQNGRYKNLLSKNKITDEDKYFKSIKNVIESNPPKQTLSITFSRGRALIYLIPLVVGSEKYDDVAYLFELGERLKHVFDKKLKWMEGVK